MDPCQTSSLRVAQWVPDTVSEGPGRRFAVWVQGCPLRCPGCCNPEMLSPEGGELWPVDRLARQILASPGIEGLTLAGGEPFFQAAACAELCERVRAGGLGVMVFSGYTLAELTGPGVDPAWGRLLARADLLVDGRYQREQPEARRRWIGSRNQQLLFFSDRYAPDDPAFTGANTVELRLVGGTLSINGWPARVL